MIKFSFINKKIAIVALIAIIASWFAYATLSATSYKKINLTCQSRGVIFVNGYTLRYVNTYRFNKNGTGASSVSGNVEDISGIANKIGIQIYFNYSLESGFLTLKNTNIIKQVENTATDEIIQKIFPPLYYKMNSEHKIVLMKMGDGYRIDYNTFPVSYCY